MLLPFNPPPGGVPRAPNRIEEPATHAQKAYLQREPQLGLWPFAAPVAAGAKFTDIVQDLNAASVAVQVVAGVAKSPASGPPIPAGRLMLSADD